MVERIELLVTVKAYPAVSSKYGEAVCVAGIRTDTQAPEHVRLFPLAYRDLDRNKQFAKYQYIALDAERHTGDRRPETYRPHINTVEVGHTVGTRRTGWEKRRHWIEPLEVESMCAVRERQRVDGTSLAIFRPHRVDDLIVEPAPEWSDVQQMRVDQPSLLHPGQRKLEPIPFRFSYRYSCGGACRGHKQSIIDWEIGQAFRQWRGLGEQECIKRLRAKWLGQLCGAARDTFFYVGNMHQRPKTFLVLGVFWPPVRPPRLF